MLTLDYITGEDPNWEKVQELADYHACVGDLALARGLLWMKRHKRWPAYDRESADSLYWRFCFPGNYPYDVSKMESHFVPRSIHPGGTGYVWLERVTCKRVIQDFIVMLNEAWAEGRFARPWTPPYATPQNPE